MKIKINKHKLTKNINPYLILRKTGYFPFFDPKSNKKSFIKKIGQFNYPRFHLYLEETLDFLTISLHLDQTKTKYKNQVAHQADYESFLVKEELKKIYKSFIQLT